MQPDAITLEPDGSSDSGRCDCCGSMSRTVWGYLHDADGAAAVYYVHWTPGRIDHGASFDIILGEWGEGTSPEDRRVVAVEFRWMSNGPQFMVIDADERPAAKTGGLADTALRRDQVIGTPLSTRVFALLDAIWLQEVRIRELTHPDA